MTDTPTITDSGILERIRSFAGAVPAAEQKVARAVLADPIGVVHLSVNEVAAAAGSSPATVIRFCRSLGLRGFQELKLQLARESIPAERQLLAEIVAGDGPAEIVTKVLSGTSSAVQDAIRAVDPTVLSRVTDHMLGARRILFAAVGTSAPLAADAAYRLTTIGLDAVFPADVHVQHVSARMLQPGDLCFAVSHTGSTIETLATVRTAAAEGATTAALTSFAQSPLTDSVDHAVIAGSRETAYRIEAMSSRIVHLAVLDAIFVMIAIRQPETQQALAATADVLVEHRL